jgi:hypothetical protein
LVLLVVSMLFCFHNLFLFLIHTRTAVRTSQQQPMVCVCLWLPFGGSSCLWCPTGCRTVCGLVKSKTCAPAVRVRFLSAAEEAEELVRLEAGRERLFHNIKKERLRLLNRSQPNHETKHKNNFYQDLTLASSRAPTREFLAQCMRRLGLELGRRAVFVWVTPR